MMKEPRSWEDVLENYRVLQREIGEKLEKLRLQDPEGRRRAAERLQPIVGKLDELISELEQFVTEFFIEGPPRIERRRGRPVKVWGKVKPLGLVGRAFFGGTAIGHLEVASGVLKEVLRSLT